MIEALQKGDEVITAGGVLGRITKLSDAYVSLEIAPNMEIRCRRPRCRCCCPRARSKASSNAAVNRYPAWKYALIALAVVAAFLYTLPNFFGESPAVQVSSAQGDAEGRRRRCWRASRRR